MAPEAPALFSTTTETFHMSLSFWPTTRASRSVPPPGAKPTMMRTGCVGRPAWACASVGSAIDAAIPVMKVLRCMGSSLGIRDGVSEKDTQGLVIASGRLLEGDGCRMGGEVFHRRCNTRIRKFDTAKLQAHLASGQCGHEGEVVAVAEVPDAEHAPLQLAQARAERQVEAFVDQLAHGVRVDAFGHHHAGEHGRLRRRLGHLDLQSPRLDRSAHALGPALVAREHAVEATERRL